MVFDADLPAPKVGGRGHAVAVHVAQYDAHDAFAVLGSDDLATTATAHLDDGHAPGRVGRLAVLTYSDQER